MPLGGSRNSGRRVSNPNRNLNSGTPGDADTLQLGRAASNLFALVSRRLRRGVYDPKKGLLVRPKRHSSSRVLETVLAAEGFAPESKPRKTRQERPCSKLCDQAFRAPHDVRLSEATTAPAKKPYGAMARGPLPRNKYG